MTRVRLAPLVSQPTEVWSQLAAVVVALAVSEPKPEVDRYEVITVIEKPRKGGESCR